MRLNVAPRQDCVPGVPGYGHTTAGGYWHPGAYRNCHKAPCQAENEKKRPRR